MKILEVCNFSSGVSGVWTRAIEDAREFIKEGYEVHIFTSDIQEDGELVSEKEEVLDGIHIKRFPVKKQKG